MDTVPRIQPVDSPPTREPRFCNSAEEAISQLESLYAESTGFLRERLKEAIARGGSLTRYRACYPEVRIVTNSYAQVDSRLSFGHVSEPGTYATTITRPDLFREYLLQQIGLLLENHGVPVSIGQSDTPLPIHFAISDDTEAKFPEAGSESGIGFPLRDLFDVPDLGGTNDDIVNGNLTSADDGAKPLAPFTAQRVDYSLARLRHYTATSEEHFQPFVLFTNYQFYVDEFIRYARDAIADKHSAYSSLVAPGDHILSNSSQDIPAIPRMPQMPAYHLVRDDGKGITLVNIGVGPSNAKTATDHIAVLRPRAWLMLGHCAGLRNGQSLGDYVLAHGYLREDQVLDKDLPVWIPVPALAEIQIALESAVEEVTKFTGYNLKRIMRTGTVATIDNRNWELRSTSGPIKRLSQSRAIALDMESATIAANGFRFRVPYGTLLCVSDKPLHGELKLPGMATQFYSEQVRKHLKIGVKALESLRAMPLEFLHSRKLRSFDETAFL
ncbi:MAG: AMP nucleosidase [Albidovulum sp.]|nr:AMP nucleosidase [Albidovulum sp.]MDE0305209.1 AMP nucleosidase [Albidovulum sp.]MDE0534152.1 AMP nucleosidase [Albidovulum sp.]